MSGRRRRSRWTARTTRPSSTSSASWRSSRISTCRPGTSVTGRGRIARSSACSVASPSTPSRGRPVHFWNSSTATAVASSASPLTSSGARYPSSASSSCASRMPTVSSIPRRDGRAGADRAPGTVRAARLLRRARGRRRRPARTTRWYQLGDTGAQARLGASGGEAAAQVDGDDAPLDRDTTQRRRSRDRAAQAARARRRRAGEERADGVRDGRCAALDRDEPSVLQEPQPRGAGGVGRPGRERPAHAAALSASSLMPRLFARGGRSSCLFAALVPLRPDDHDLAGRVLLCVTADRPEQAAPITVAVGADDEEVGAVGRRDEGLARRVSTSRRSTSSPLTSTRSSASSSTARQPGAPPRGRRRDRRPGPPSARAPRAAPAG